MEDKKNFFKAIFSLLKYREKAEPSFSIPVADSNSTEEAENINPVMEKSIHSGEEKNRIADEKGENSPSNNAGKKKGKDFGNSSECKPIKNQNNRNERKIAKRRSRRIIINSVPVAPVQKVVVEKQNVQSADHVKQNGDYTSEKSQTKELKNDKTKKPDISKRKKNYKLIDFATAIKKYKAGKVLNNKDNSGTGNNKESSKGKSTDNICKTKDKDIDSDRNGEQDKRGDRDKNKDKDKDKDKDKEKDKNKDIGRDKTNSNNNDTENGIDIKTCISSDIEENLSYLKKSFNHPENKDVVFRMISIANGIKAFIFYIDGMADRNTINQSILKPLLDKSKFECPIEQNLYDYIFTSIIETHQLKDADNQETAISDVLTGNTGVYINGYPDYILCETKGYEKRSVEKPQVEGVVKGPQEAFNENLRTNITLVRRILKNKELTTDFHDIGERGNAKCAVVYIKDLANPAIVGEATKRVKGIDTDIVIGDGVLEQFIEDSPMSIFPTILSTERPDRVASHLSEGKVVIFGEYSPFALVVPVTIADFLHTPEDTSLRWQYGTMLRFIRLFAIFVATLLPGLYVALTTFHREMIPTDLLIAIAKARENVPFPTIVEVMLMELSFELIREAGIRIPGIIGNTLGIIGALILGQAAVQANLVSPVMIIVVAFTGLGNFAIPDFSLAFSVRIMRIFFIITGAFLGFYGISLAFVIILAYSVNLKSFGVPIWATMAPKTRRSFDFLLRWPVWKQEERPDYLNPLDITRQPKRSRKWARVKPDQG